jgi:hypothetical protein
MRNRTTTTDCAGTATDTVEPALLVEDAMGLAALTEPSLLFATGV